MSILSKVRVGGVDYDLMGLGGDVLPVGTEVDIDSTAAIPAGWEEVDDKYEIYSTDEKCIGRWIDGKPLYRKGIKLTSGWNIGGEATFSHNISNVSEIFVENSFAKRSDGTFQPIPNGHKTVNTYAFGIFDVSTTSYTIYIGDQQSRFTIDYIYVVLRYTKTSDTTNSPITKRIKKVSQTMPPELLEKYSTDEIVVGTWIDGKPLYRKVLSYSISGQSAYPVNITIPTGYTSTEYTIRDMRGILYGSDYAINLNRSARWTNSETSENMNLIQTTNGIHLVITKADTEVNYFNGCDGIVIIEYTKTTD